MSSIICYLYSRQHHQPAGEEAVIRDEHRAKCIEAIARAMCRQYYLELIGFTLFGPPETVAEEVQHRVEKHWQEWLPKATEVLDSLHGIARVNPIEATAEMIEAAYYDALAEDAEGVWDKIGRAHV